MTRLLALAHFLLALGGCSLGATSYSHRVAGDGGDVLRSEILIEDGIARFRCIESDSGACHYTLYVTPDAAACTGAACTSALRHFAVARGGERRITGLVGFRPCVSADEPAPGPDCRAPVR